MSHTSEGSKRRGDPPSPLLLLLRLQPYLVECAPEARALLYKCARQKMLLYMLACNSRIRAATHCSLTTHEIRRKLTEKYTRRRRRRRRRDEVRLFFFFSFVSWIVEILLFTIYPWTNTSYEAKIGVVADKVVRAQSNREISSNIAQLLSAGKQQPLCSRFSLPLSHWINKTWLFLPD